MTTSSKDLPTSQGKKMTKKSYILEYSKNRHVSALEIANKIGSTPSYVFKVRSQVRRESKQLRGRNGRIFAHGKAYYQWSVMHDTVDLLKAPVVNKKTGMKQIGLIENDDPCSCQIHANGRLIVWVHNPGWKDWLLDEFIAFGWKKEVARYVIDNLMVNVSVVEGGVKPLDASFLPEELRVETEWGVVIVRDNTPEKGVLEIKFNIPDMKRYLGLQKIQKQLEVIEHGSVTLNQSYKMVVALLASMDRLWRRLDYLISHNEEENKC